MMLKLCQIVLIQKFSINYLIINTLKFKPTRSLLFNLWKSVEKFHTFPHLLIFNSANLQKIIIHRTIFFIFA